MTSIRHLLFPFALLISVAPLHAEKLAPLAPGKPFDYSKHAFRPKSWEERGLDLKLTPWTGEKVVFLTTGDAFEPALMARWVSRLDGGWKLYEELTGAKPREFKHIDGKVTIAAVPGAELTCGAGCGYIGATGIELAMFYDHDHALLKEKPEAMPHYVFYEMGRNYYTFGDRHSCFITGFAVFMRYVCMDSLKCEDADAGTRKVIEGFFRELATCPDAPANTKDGALSQGWYWMLSASVAAKKDLSPVFAGEWKLPLDARTREALAKIDWKKQDLTVKEVAAGLTPGWQG